jgi:hypothetical protein
MEPIASSPVHVDDVAAIAVTAGLTRDNLTVDAAGPDILRFDELVRMLRQAVESQAVLLKTAPALALAGARVAGFIAGDAILTREQQAVLGLRYASAQTRHRPRLSPLNGGNA